MKTIQVKDADIRIRSVNEEDYICLTDMAKGVQGEDHIKNWMRNRNTLEYIGVWEQLNNPKFKGVEFDTFKQEAGLNRFTMTPKKWIAATDAIGFVVSAGRGGGTYAHKDIAFHFCMWISPEFQLYVVKEYQRLKELESNTYNLEWNVRRILSKTNYHLHTDAIKEYVLPSSTLPHSKHSLLYAEEADVLNLALFGCTAKEWREANPKRVLAGENIRDMASINELTILSNLEQTNALLMKQGVEKAERFHLLQEMAQAQKQRLDQLDLMKSIKRTTPEVFLGLDKQ